LVSVEAVSAAEADESADVSSENGAEVGGTAADLGSADVSSEAEVEVVETAVATAVTGIEAEVPMDCQAATLETPGTLLSRSR
jgi:hypothetical protein